MPNIAPAYQASKGSPLDVDRRSISASRRNRMRGGWWRSWSCRYALAAPGVCRPATCSASLLIDGPQVGDLNIWNYHNPRERMWASRSRQLQAAHVSTFDRLWSNLPYLRPLVTITEDSLAGLWRR